MPASPLFQAVILGILQGLTEFLPISSSAHLLLLPWFLGWKPLGVTFDVMLHGGTLLAVLYFFRLDLKTVSIQTMNRFRGRGIPDGATDLFWPIILGTLPAALIGAAFHKQLEDYFRAPIVTVVTLSVFGAILFWVDRRRGRMRILATIRPLDGLLIGTAQVLAFIPGVSRSGITITAALVLGFGRVDSARFSFLLAIPIIGLATLSKVYELFVAGGASQDSVGPLLVGVLFSFLSGFLCIKYFLRYLQTRSYGPFALYRLALAAVILMAIWRG